MFDNGLIEVLVLIVAIAIGKLIYNWYAEIEKRNRIIEAQLKVTLLLAYKEKIDRDPLRQIIVDSKVPLSENVIKAMNAVIDLNPKQP